MGDEENWWEKDQSEGDGPTDEEVEEYFDHVIKESKKKGK